MTRQQYLNMRRTRQLNITYFYQYYVRNVGNARLSLDVFTQAFPMWVQGNVSMVFARLDSVFHIRVLTDPAGNEISYH